MKKFILFGSGCFGQRLCRYLQRKEEYILEFVDNDEWKWNQFIEGIKVYPPSHINEADYRYIVICVSDFYYESIYDQLENELHVDKASIIHWTYWLRKEFLDYYKNHSDSSEIDEIVKRVEESDRLVAFNYGFTEKYVNYTQCIYDDSSQMFYTNYKRKKLYLSRKYKTKQQAEKYVDSLFMEQDELSPHRYLDYSFEFEGGCLLDAGAAEGNFALEIIEKADKVILLECDDSWIEALKKTFEPWQDKVVIINKYLSDVEGDDSVTIDALANDYNIDFIKMDIEGAEVSAIKGGMNYIRHRNSLKMAVCVYHNIGDEEAIRDILEDEEIMISTTDGYMVFPDNMGQPPRLVKGVLRLQKSNG